MYSLKMFYYAFKKKQTKNVFNVFVMFVLIFCYPCVTNCHLTGLVLEINNVILLRKVYIWCNHSKNVLGLNPLSVCQGKAIEFRWLDGWIYFASFFHVILKPKQLFTQFF